MGGTAGSQETELEGWLSHGLFVNLDKSFLAWGLSFLTCKMGVHNVWSSHLTRFLWDDLGEVLIGKQHTQTEALMS